MAGLDQFWACVWQMSWQSAALAAVVLATNLLLRRAMPASWRCAMWLLVAVRLMVPMLPGSAWSIFNLLQSRETMPVLIHPVGHTTVTVRYGPISFDREQPTELTLPDVHSSGWMLTGTGIWLLGVFILLGRQIVNEWRSVVMVRNMPRISETRVLEMVERCRQKMKLWRRVRAVSSANVRTPAICGFWRATLILPAENQLSTSELEMVIFHELAHVLRFDLQIDRLLSILRAVHWFNPMAWLLLRNWRSEREMACDETVLRIVGENQRTEYGRIILDMVERFSNLRPAAGAVGLFESSSDLHRRIRMIGSYNPSRIRWAAGMFIALSVAGCLLTDARAENTTAPSTADVQPPASDDGESVRVYDISDLVLQVIRAVPFSNEPLSDLDNPPRIPSTKEIADRHAQVIQDIIHAAYKYAPANSWRKNGGKGTITRIPGQDQIIVAQTAPDQEKIGAWLASWHHAAGMQVNIEAHFVVLDDQVLKKVGLTAEAIPGEKMHAPHGFYLDDGTAKQILQLVGKDRHCQVVAAPRVTVFDHQEADVTIQKQMAYVGDLSKVSQAGQTIYSPIQKILKTGPVLEVRADITPDNKAVIVNFHARLTELVELKSVKWNDDPKEPTIQQPVVDIHEGPSRSSAFVIPATSISMQSTLMEKLNDTQTEKAGRSVWVLIHPTILEAKNDSPKVRDGHGHPVKE